MQRRRSDRRRKVPVAWSSKRPGQIGQSRYPIVRQQYLYSNKHQSNTTDAYKNKQREFVQWCRARPELQHEPLPELVTSGKLLLFLLAQNHRPSRKDPTKEIGFDTYQQYAAAVIDLYQFQV
jgi:hypothetical protein